MDNLTELASWAALKEHSLSMQLSTLNDLHEASESRQQQYTITSKHITLDYSNQRFNETTLKLLLALANERDLSEKIHRLMQGDIVNLSEKKPAL